MFRAAFRSIGIERLRGDVRFAFRNLRQSAGFALTAVMTLGLGIGLSTAVFTVADALLLRPLPVRDQARILVLSGETADGHFPDVPLNYREAREFTRRTRVLQQVAFVTYEGAQPVPVVDRGRLFRLRRSVVSGNYFDLLGTRAIIGRTLNPSDDVVGAAPVAVLSYDGWRRAFGGDSSVIGRQLQSQLDGVSFTVVGVMPQGLEYPAATEYWAPLVPTRTVAKPDSVVADVNLVGRLADRATPGAARAEVTAYFRDLQTNGGPLGRLIIRGVANTLPRIVLGDTQPALFVVLAAAALLLLITCVNVGNLLLVRGLARTREIAVRTALGASRARVVAQLLTENVMLAVAGGAAGIAIATAAVKVFVHYAPAAIPRVGEIGLDARALGGAIAITAAALLLSGLAPALLGSRAEMLEVLRSGTRQSARRQTRIVGRALVAGQIALAVTIISVAGLLVNSYARLARATLGFDDSHLLIAEPSLRYDIYNDTPKQLAVLDRIIASLQAVPGVVSVAPVVAIPFSGNGGWDGDFAAEGQTPEQARQNPVFNMEVVTPTYFATLGIPVQQGRPFVESDDRGAPSVVILNASAARLLWPGMSAIGRRVRVMDRKLATVIGLVPDTRYRDLREARPSIYFPLRQSLFPYVPLTFAIRAAGDPLAVVPALRHAFAQSASGVALESADSFESLLGGPLALPRLNALLLSVFAAAALLLAAVGLYAVVAAAVRQRTREFGIRLALGASPGALGRTVLREALAVAVVGTGAGVVGALALSRAVRSLVFEVSPSDPATLGAVALLLLLVAVVAAHPPARHAARTDPLQALRTE